MRVDLVWRKDIFNNVIAKEHKKYKMTEKIKQWVSDEAVKMATMPGFTGEVVHQNVQLGAISGLSKGIEIAQGFAEWQDDSPYYKFGPNNWKHLEDGQPNVTTSQLLEMYLSHLLNKEK